MTKDQLIKPFQYLLDERYRWVFHVIFWVVMYLDEFLSIAGITEPLDDYPAFFKGLLADMIMVYLNLYVLIPFLLMKGKTLLYIFLTLLSILIAVGINYYVMFYEYEIDSSFFYGSLSGTISLIGTGAGFKIFKTYIKNQEKISDLQSDNLQTELAYLKEQINPHFLFNALNGIYVQSRKRPEEVPESVLLLSDLLRYQLYDCTQETVPLKGEIEYLNNYLKLEKGRKSDTKIDFQIDGNPNDKMVAPFIFIPFVENAIKHGVSLDTTSVIDIRLDIKEDEILFNIKNSKPSQPTQHLGGGIGLPNIKRRLDLLYPNAHDLKILDEQDTFSVNLSIKDKK